MKNDSRRGDFIAAGKVFSWVASTVIGFVYAPEIFSIDLARDGLMVKKFFSGILFFFCGAAVVALMEIIFCNEKNNPITMD